MILLLLTLFAGFWFLWSYTGWILSTVLSILLRCQIKVGGVRWLAIYDVRVRLPGGITVQLDSCSLQIFNQQFSKPLLILIGDVRIETDSAVFTEKCSSLRPSSGGSGSSAMLGRLKHVAQYCGLSVNSVHMVLLEAVPHCMIHITVDELNIETFRSREGWQLEISCRLAQGKVLRRKSNKGRPLADFGLLFHISVDVADSKITRLGLRIADPSFTISSDIFELVQEHKERNLNMSLNPENDELISTTRSSLEMFDGIVDLSVSVDSCLIKYMSTDEPSRSLSLQVREVTASKKDGIMNTNVNGLAVMDQLMRSALRTSQLTIAMQNHPSGPKIDLFSDSVQTSLSIQDVLWWRTHFQTVLKEFGSVPKIPSSPGASYRQLSILCNIEVNSFICELVDVDSFQSTLSMQFLTFALSEQELEIGIESLCFSAPGTDVASASYDVHQWGQSVYVGVALIQYNRTSLVPDLLICIDDVKLEWSDRLAKQIHKLLLTINSQSEASSKKLPSNTNISIKTKTQRAAIISVAKESTYLMYLCDELVFEGRNDPFEFVASSKNSRIGIGTVAGNKMNLSELRQMEKSVPQKDDASGQLWRIWSQAEKDKRKYERRKEYEEQRCQQVKLVGSADLLCFSVEYLTPATRDVTVSSNSDVYFAWSPLLHRVLYHMKCIAKETFTMPKKSNRTRKPPRVLQLKVLTNRSVELDLELPRYHRMIWKVPSLNLEFSSNDFSVISSLLTITMNGHEIVKATDVCISRRFNDPKMDSVRRAINGLQTPTNKVWTWAADSFSFYLPFEFNFHEVFNEFINCIKWMKIVHQTKKKPFTADSPLPCDLRISFQRARLELEDDPFENLLQASHELKEDEVYECERRRQMLEDRLSAIKKGNPLFSQSKIDELYSCLLEKNSDIYIERWKKADHPKRPLFVSQWEGFEIRAFADITLHGTDTCVQLMHLYDPLSYFPTDGLHFSTLWARAVEFDMEKWTVHFKDYTLPYVLAKEMHFFGQLCGAESYEDGGRSLRECTVPLPEPFETHVVQRNMSPLKFYYDMQCESSEFTATYGPCWEPCLSMISLMWNNISAPSKDPSKPLPFWDKMRFLLHGRFSWLSNKTVTVMLASPDPYNTTETVEMCWDEYGLDWALGELRIRSGFRVFMRTASKYDDSKILLLPDLRLRVALEWICGGDPHDHHAVTLCAPHRLPHYSTDHDSYRAFRSQFLDLSFSFDVAAGATGVDRIPQVLLYANTFRCIEFLMHTLTIKNRTIKRGRVFGTPAIIKPQLSKHFRNVQVSVNFPKFYITYWMSHSSSFGFRVTSDGLNLSSSLRLTMKIESDSEITRRRTYAWTPQHVSATLWGTKVHVYGDNKKPSSEEGDDDNCLLLSISRVSYVRENNAGKENAVHRLTAHELNASWTAETRDACLSIADGVHRAHMLRRILSNDAIKILKLHMEEERSTTSAPQAETVNSDVTSNDERGHRRGYSISDTNQSMLTQLIDEANTKLIAHCEQSADLPADSLQGVLHCTKDDVLMINWQIDLLNSQVVLKGCDRKGFILVTSAKASLTQKMHKCVWRNGQLLGKKSWSAAISGMQYFAPSGGGKYDFHWAPREVIEEQAPPDTGADSYHTFVDSGEAVGGVVSPDSVSDHKEVVQLQRIVSRCSCQIYFCYFSEELKTDALEETGVPKIENDSALLRPEEVGVDCLTLKHNMLMASTSSDQYEMVVDIVNNLVLFIDPKKKELAEHRGKLRFECQLLTMKQMRDGIVELQSQLRDIVSVVRSLERQIFYLDTQAGGTNETKRKELMDEMEDYKTHQLEVSDELSIYISCYKQRQVESARAVVHCVEDDGLAAVARRFEVCFEDCIWRLTETDGQLGLAETQIRNFLYTRTMRIDNSGEHHFEVGSLRVTNLLPDAMYKDTLHRDERLQTRQPAIRLLLRDMPPVGGICVKEHFEVNIAPMVVQLSSQLYDKIMGFFFPGKNIHNNENLDALDESTQKFSFTRRIAGTLSMRNAKTVQVDRKASTISGGKVSSKAIPESEMDEIEKMRLRADRNIVFLYIKIPEVPFLVTYKSNKKKNIQDIDRFSFLFPLCEFHDRNWTWLDLSLAVKSRCKRVLLQQFMKQKLLSNRLTGRTEPVEGITEEDKKKIALGSTSAIEKRKKK